MGGLDFTMDKQPLVSVIIPVRNASEMLSRCLGAIKKSSYPSYEIIVVDDASTDASSETATQNGAFVLRLERQSGPAEARNRGAERAKGDVLLFVDSDVMIRHDTIGRVVNDFSEHIEIGAVFGSYDDDPPEKNFASQYKNMVHHFVHQVSRPEAVTFWAGCGAVRKKAFLDVGGFDAGRYPRPSIEDIELGYRLRKSGFGILLDKEMQVKHLKKWTVKSVLRVDIFDRAIPWTKLILESQEMVTDLNLQVSQKISAGLVGLIVLFIPLSFLVPPVFWVVVTILITILVINKRLFLFFLRLRGVSFAIRAFGMQLLYYFYSGVTFSVCWVLNTMKSTRKKDS